MEHCRVRHPIVRSAALLVFLWITAFGAQSAELSADPVSTAALTVELVIRFNSQGSAVAALQFDVKCSPLLRIPSAPGAAVVAAGKKLYVETVGRPRRGAAVQQLRFLIIGLDRGALRDGIVASLPVMPGFGIANIRGVVFSDISASDMNGKAVLVTGRPSPPY